jgi:hypothetical protein
MEQPRRRIRRCGARPSRAEIETVVRLASTPRAASGPPLAGLAAIPIQYHVAIEAGTPTAQVDEILAKVDAQHERLNAVYSRVTAPAGVTPDAQHNPSPAAPELVFAPEVLSRSDPATGKPGHVQIYNIAASGGWAGASSSSEPAIEASIIAYLELSGTTTFDLHFSPHVVHVFLAKFAASLGILGVAGLGTTRIACVDYRTMPGGIASGPEFASFANFDDGNTLVHEMGHAFGLPHPFNDQIDLPSDWQTRTNWAAYPCPGPVFAVEARFPANANQELHGGFDDAVCYRESNSSIACNSGDAHAEIYNFMNYLNDENMQSFNVAQSLQMRVVAAASPLDRADANSAAAASVFFATEPAVGSVHYNGQLRVLLNAIPGGGAVTAATVSVNGGEVFTAAAGGGGGAPDPASLFDGALVTAAAAAGATVVISVTRETTTPGGGGAAATTQSLTVHNVTIVAEEPGIAPGSGGTPISDGKVVSFTLSSNGGVVFDAERTAITVALNAFAASEEAGGGVPARIGAPGETPADPGEALVYFEERRARGYTIVVATFATAEAAEAALAALRSESSSLVLHMGVPFADIGNLTRGVFRPLVATTQARQWRRVLLLLLSFLAVSVFVAVVAVIFLSSEKGGF